MPRLDRLTAKLAGQPMAEWEQVVARNVRRLRKERGLTQEQLALEAEVALRYVGMIEGAETSAKCEAPQDRVRGQPCWTG